MPSRYVTIPSRAAVSEKLLDSGRFVLSLPMMGALAVTDDGVEETMSPNSYRMLTTSVLTFATLGLFVTTPVGAALYGAGRAIRPRNPAAGAAIANATRNAPKP